jgi:hypothetical protein
MPSMPPVLKTNLLEVDYFLPCLALFFALCLAPPPWCFLAAGAAGAAAGSAAGAPASAGGVSWAITELTAKADITIKIAKKFFIVISLDELRIALFSSSYNSIFLGVKEFSITLLVPEKNK